MLLYKYRKAYLLLCLQFAAYFLFGATPIKEIPNLVSITFYEKTGALSAFQLSLNSDALNNRISGVLNTGNNDFQGWVGNEFYDVFISDYDGTPNPNGAFISIESEFNNTNGGGGLNISKVELNYSDGTNDYCKILASYFAHGNNYNIGSENNVVDGNVNTHCTMGNTNGINERLRITIGVDYIYSEFNYDGCKNDGFSIVINNVRYDELNPTGIDTLFNENGCDTIFMVDLSFMDCVNEQGLGNCPLFIPNIISTNYDGFNDDFQVYTKSSCEFLNFNIVIFDRWGNLLFESNDPGFKWDGQFKGKFVDDGVVVWRMEFEIAGEGKIESRTGGLTVIH